MLINTHAQPVLFSLPSSLHSMVTESFTMNRRNRHTPARRFVLALACGLLLAGTAGCVRRAAEEPVPDDQAVLQQNERASELVRIGDELRRNGDLVAAADVYGRAMRADPDSPLPPALLGDTLRRLKRYNEAEQVFVRALERNPYSGLSLQGYGILMIEKGQPEAAISALTNAVDEEAADYRVYNVLGIAHDALGDHTQAQTYYTAGQEQAPGNQSLRNNMALSLALQERYDAAIEQMKQLAGSGDGDETYRHNLALIYGLGGRIEDASETLRPVLPAADVANNLAYYQSLRAMETDARREAVLDVVLRSIFLSRNDIQTAQ